MGWQETPPQKIKRSTPGISPQTFFAIGIYALYAYVYNSYKSYALHERQRRKREKCAILRHNNSNFRHFDPCKYLLHKRLDSLETKLQKRTLSGRHSSQKFSANLTVAVSRKYFVFESLGFLQSPAWKQTRTASDRSFLSHRNYMQFLLIK